MFGSGSFAQFAFCEQAAIIAPPAPNLISNDGFKRGERRKYQELNAKLERAQNLRIKARLKSREDLHRTLTAQIAPELLPPEETFKKPQAPTRSVLSVKSPQLIEADINDYIEQINQINRARWFRIAREYEARLEAARLAEIDDEETLLLLI